MHYRTAGEIRMGQRPLLMLHASPGSSRQLEPLIAALAHTRRVVAPDTPGNGDSPAISAEDTTVVSLAQAMLDFIDAAGLATVDVYGSHTGACIAAELAILAPARIGAVILDGAASFARDVQQDYLRHYAPPFPADRSGAYLVDMLQFCRDQALFYPWFRGTAECRRGGGLMKPEDLHAWLTEVMKANETYHHNYHAAFRWNGEERAGRIAQPVLMIAAENDPLFADTMALSGHAPTARFVPLPASSDTDFPARRLAALHQFLDQPEGAMTR